MGLRELLLLPFRSAAEIHGQPPQSPASGVATEPPECAVVQFPVARFAEASITLDDVRVFVHIGPTRATFADVMEALQSAVDRLQIRDQAQPNCDEARKAA